MFNYAASYFRDPDAQYYLARLYLNGTGAPRDPRQAARWFGLSAQKGQCEAQAMLGAMLLLSITTSSDRVNMAVRWAPKCAVPTRNLVA